MAKKLYEWYQLVMRFSRKMRDDFVASFAAQGAFFIIISVFPFTMFLLTLIQYLPIKESDLLNLVNTYFPDSFRAFLVSIIEEVCRYTTKTIISITAITTLWSASRGSLAIIKGLNNIYGIRETRNYFKIRFLAILYTLVFTVMLIGSMFFLVFGNSLLLWVQTRVPALEDLALLIISIRTIVVLLVLLLFFLAIYLYIPDRKSHLIYELPGALVSAGGWMVFSYGYSYYIDHMGSMSNTYGSLTAVVLMMLWLYFCMYILFFGGEVNHYLRNLTNTDFQS